MPLFIQIVNWNDRFENARSRELKATEWFPMSNSVTHPTFKLLMFRADGTPNMHGLTYWGIWTMILMLASNNPGRYGVALGRGVLVQENGRPHTALSIALQAFGGPDLVARVNECIDLLVSLNEISLVDEDVLLGRKKILDQTPAKSGDLANKSSDATSVRDSGENLAPPPPPNPDLRETVRDSGRALSTRGRARKELGKGKDEQGIGNSERKPRKNTTRNSARERALGKPQKLETGSTADAVSPAPLAEGLAEKPKNEQPKKDTLEPRTDAGEAARPVNEVSNGAYGKGSKSTGTWVTSDVMDVILGAADGTPQEERVLVLLSQAEQAENALLQQEFVFAAFRLLPDRDKEEIVRLCPQLSPGFFDTLIRKAGRLRTDHVKAALFLHGAVREWTGMPRPSKLELCREAEIAFAMFERQEMSPATFVDLVMWIGQHNVDSMGRVTSEFSWRHRIKSVADIRRFWTERKFHGFSARRAVSSLEQGDG